MRGSLGISETPRHCFEVTSARAVSRNSIATAEAAGESSVDAIE